VEITSAVARQMNNGALVVELIDAAYDNGYYSGQNKDGSELHKIAIKRRETLRKEVLKRLAKAG
jgi:hypothetical protein